MLLVQFLVEEQARVHCNRSGEFFFVGRSILAVFFMIAWFFVHLLILMPFLHH